MTRRRTVCAAATLVAALLAPPAALALFDPIVLAPSGKVVAETRGAKGFAGIGLAIPGTVVLRQAPAESVTIEADDNLLPEIETVVEGGSLKIRFKRNLRVTGRPTIRILVSGPVFDSLSVSGSGDILAEALEAGALGVSIAGSGDVKIARLEAGTLKISIAGSGDVQVAGRADEMTAKIAGSGDIAAGTLDAKRASVSISGSGDVMLRVRDSLAVSIAGSGDVRYHGDPAVTKKIAGSGSLKRLGPAP